MIRAQKALSLGDRLRLRVAKSHRMLELFVDHVWYSSNRRIRDRLFRYLGEAQAADLVYVKQGLERYLLHPKDRVIGRALFLSGQFDFEKMEAALRTVARHTGLERPDTLVDVGANIGTTCLPALSRGLVQRAIAIEPDPSNCRLLRINALLNEVESRLTIHECAVGEHDDGVLTLERSGDNWGDHRISVSADDGPFGEAARARIEVPSRRLDRLVPSPADGAGILLWMDTQGYEGHVLSGATELLARRVPLVAEFWPYAMKRAQSFAKFRAAVAHYRGFVDLGAQDSARLRPIAELDALFESLDRDKDAYTDIAVL